MTHTLSSRSRKLAELIGAAPTARVQLKDLWGLLDRVVPATRMDPGRRALLAELLEQIAAAGLIAMPSPRSYDRTQSPPLPRFVTVTRPDSLPAPTQDVIWHPDLAWADSMRPPPTAAQRDRLIAINRWLHRERDDFVVPLRERSLEILGDEKALDRILLTNLAGPGRLSLEILRARRVVPPLHIKKIGDGTILLVVENSDTFDSLTRVLTHRPGGIGMVAWGAGAGFEASVLSITEIDRPVSAIKYFGDLDVAGLRIPSNASRLAVERGLPAVTPAAALYSELLRVGVCRPGQPTCSPDDAEQLVQWLAPEHRAKASERLISGQRMAQEAVGMRRLRSMADSPDILCNPVA